MNNIKTMVLLVTLTLILVWAGGAEERIARLESMGR